MLNQLKIHYVTLLKISKTYNYYIAYMIVCFFLSYFISYEENDTGNVSSPLLPNTGSGSTVMTSLRDTSVTSLDVG